MPDVIRLLITVFTCPTTVVKALRAKDVSPISLAQSDAKLTEHTCPRKAGLGSLSAQTPPVYLKIRTCSLAPQLRLRMILPDLKIQEMENLRTLTSAISMGLCESTRLLELMGFALTTILE